MAKYISLTEIANRYGYSYNAIKKWIHEGLPHVEAKNKCPELEATQWILKNKINPLREISTREALDIAKLREQEAKADLATMAVKERAGELIHVDYVQAELNRFLGNLKDSIRLIPAKYAIDILEHADSKENLKEYLRYLIDGTLEQLEPIFEEPNLNHSEQDQDSENVPVDTE
ncbi:hypothetical protein ACRZ4V_003953 [Enterobacter hormaechei]